MHNHKKSGVFYLIARCFIPLLIVVFWCFLIFAFDEPYAAVTTLFAATVHEIGHKLAFFAVGSSSALPRPKVFGLKINSTRYASYGKDILCALAGPLANLFFCLLGLPLLFFSRDAYTEFAVINSATALTNLLPVRGYDGYKIITSVLQQFSSKTVFINIIDVFSFATIAALVFFSLYLIGKFSEGYWLFAIFFFALLSEVRKGIKE